MEVVEALGPFVSESRLKGNRNQMHYGYTTSRMVRKDVFTVQKLRTHTIIVTVASSQNSLCSAGITIVHARAIRVNPRIIFLPNRQPENRPWVTQTPSRGRRLEQVQAGEVVDLKKIPAYYPGAPYPRVVPQERRHHRLSP
jgi:hypothetical protein